MLKGVKVSLWAQAPAYIHEMLLPYEPERCLRSAGRALLYGPEVPSDYKR